MFLQFHYVLLYIMEQNQLHTAFTDGLLENPQKATIIIITLQLTVSFYAILVTKIENYIISLRTFL